MIPPFKKFPLTRLAVLRTRIPIGRAYWAEGLTRTKHDSVATVDARERGVEKSQNRCDNQEKRDHESLLLCES